VRQRSASVVVAGLLLVGLFWVSAGCGGGGGGGGPTAPPPPTQPPMGVTFTADAPASANSVYLVAGSGGSPGRFVLDVEVQNVTDLYGVGFVLEYPAALLKFEKNGTTEGTFLSDNGAFDTDLVAKARTAGEVTVGISRLGLVPGADGSGTLLSLEFTTRANGSGALVFAENDALDSLGEVQEDVTWIGGSATVRVN